MYPYIEFTLGSDVENYDLMANLETSKAIIIFNLRNFSPSIAYNFQYYFYGQLCAEYVEMSCEMLIYGQQWKLICCSRDV